MIRWLALAWIVFLLLSMRWGYTRAIAKARMAGREDMRRIFADDIEERRLRIVPDPDATRTVEESLREAMRRGRRRAHDKPDDPEAA